MPAPPICRASSSNQIMCRTKISLIILLFLQAHAAPRPSANVASTMPPPIVQQPPKQPANDLLGDLGGDPFAQTAGTLYSNHCTLSIF